MDCLLASIFGGFWPVLGRQVGKENRAKSEQKSIKKRIEKMMKKECVLEAPGGGASHAPWRGGDSATH